MSSLSWRGGGIRRAGIVMWCGKNDPENNPSPCRGGEGGVSAIVYILRRLEIIRELIGKRCQVKIFLEHGAVDIAARDHADQLPVLIDHGDAMHSGGHHVAANLEDMRVGGGGD